MKKYLINILALVLSVVMCSGVFAAGGINTGGGALPFGQNTQYNYGIMPTNLPSSGTYGQAQKAADAYTAWKNAYVTSCGSGSYRVLFDDNSSTVSEGIAYGMLLSVYADDKDLFDGLWTYYQANMNSNGVMNWKISGCSGVSGSNGATDAELDVAMALIIASEQWGSSYASVAKSFIQTIKNKEMATNGQTLNGDAWGNTNSCRNPSYFAPAYYIEFAKVDTDNASFWNTTAINATNTILKENMNSTSGLVSNWCDDSGTENSCGNTGSGANGYGADACRNPWRMAVDYLWHGSSASSAATTINAKLVSFVKGYEDQMKGPFSNRSVSNPSSGSYINGSYTTFALPPMTSSSAQSSLNKCYTAVANLADVDAYFNSTIRCISLFVLTGNFWAPGASGFVFPPAVSAAETDDTGLKITLTMSKTMSAGTSSGSNFTVYYNGTAQSGIVSNVTVNSDKTVVLTLTTAPQPGQTITLSYNGNGNIKSSEDATLEAFTKYEVLNMIAGSETIIDDVDDGNEVNNLGGIWFSFNDVSNYNPSCTHKDLDYSSGSSSSISPLSEDGVPLEITKTGYDGTGYCIYASFKLGKGYCPYSSGTTCASWANPAFVGIGTYVDKTNEAVVDWSKGTGVTFYYKGPACSFQVVTTDVTDGGYHYWSVDECTSWTKITKLFTELTRPSWVNTTVAFDPTHVQKLQWQWESSVLGKEYSGELYIDEVHVLNMPPVELTGLTISPVSDSDLEDDNCSANIDPLKIPIASGVKGDTLYLETTPTPTNATYPVAMWSSSDEDVVTVDYQGRVIGVGYGEATITARSKMHQNIYTTYTVKVPAPSVNPTAISFEESSYEVTVGETTTIIPTFSPTGVTETGLTWSSADKNIASVSSSGVVTGIAAGTVKITATSTAVSSVTKSVTVTVKAVAVTGISVDNSEVNLELGESETVTATVTPSSVSQAITATSSDTDVATVSVSGSTISISSVGVGTATITVASQADPTFTTTINVTVTGISITGVTISGTETEIVIGATTTLTATVAPAAATQNVTWTSSDDKIATVTGGVVKGIAKGSATITATSTEDPTKSDTYTITVNPVMVTDIAVSPATKTLAVGGTQQLSATVTPTTATDKTYTWSSSDEDVATVDADGLVTALKIGTATITATANDGSGVKGICAITVEATQVTSITVVPATATLKVAGTQQLSATVLPADATDKTYTWSSSDEKVATVDATGLVTAIKIGTATIKATANDGSGVIGTCDVTVEATLVTSISVLPATATIKVGETETLTASVLPKDATDATYTWSSSDEKVATIVDGVVTAIKAGSCTISATANDGSAVAGTCEVTVENVMPTSITMATTLGFTVGDAAQSLTPTIAPANTTDQTITWSSSDENVATVIDGVVTPVGEGTCTITATANADKTVTAICTVSVVSSSIAVTAVSIPTTATVYFGKTETLTATITPDDATNKSVTWSSSDEAVATVDANGVVTGKGIGNATITVTTVDGSFTANCAVTVSHIEITSITLDQTTLSLTMSSVATQLTATYAPDDATNTALTWESSDETVATVSATGVVTPVALGNATITVKNADGSVKATCVVTVSAIAIESVTLDKTALSFTPSGAAQTLTATVKPDDATDKTVTWSSDDTDVATVVNGVVTPQGIGSCVITASCGGKTATCNVTVSAVEITSVELDVTTLTFTMGDAAQALTATVKPDDATVKTVSWSSDNTDVVTVVNGVVTPVGVGTATITATSDDGNFTASCDVTVTDILATNILIDNALSLYVGESNTISLTILPAEAAQTATWTSSNESVATVDATGKVTAIAKGSAKITATTTDGTDLISDPCVVTVSNIEVSSIALDKTSKVIRLSDGTATLTATITPTNATNKEVNWSSSKTTIATVADGVITAVAVGSTTITAASADDAYIKATCAVEVVDASALSAELTTANASYKAAVEGTEIGQYKSGSKSTFLTAIAEAQTVFDNADASQTEIDAALASLQTAEKAFEKAIISNETLIFNADMKQENMTYMATYWFSFNDAEPGGSSTISPLSSEESPFSMTEYGYDGTGKAAMMEYVLNGKAELGYNPFVGMGMNFGTTTGEAFDMTGSTGISFWMKNQSPVYFEVELTGIADACDYYIYLPTHSDWTLVELAWSDLEQYSWGKKVTWDLAELTKCQWKVQEDDGEAGQVWVDEVKILGVALDLPEIIDYEALYTAIADAQELVDAAVVGDYDGNYPQKAVTTLTTAIETASAVIDNAKTQSVADKAVTTLRNAIATFEKAVVSVDKSTLEATIATAEEYYASAEEGYQEGMYLVGSKAILQAAIDAANDVYNSAAVNQTAVNKANTTLQNAIDVFLNSKFDPSSINRTALETALDEANELYANSTEGTGDGQYPTGSKSVLYAAISVAQAADDNSGISQEEIDEATSTLREAIETFKDLQISVDKTKLNSTISTANGLYSSAVEGYLKGNYPTGSKAILMDAINAAQAVYDAESSSQIEVNTAISTLNAAINTFKASIITVDKATLSYTIEKAKTSLTKADGNTGDGSGQYPQSAVSIFTTAIEEAQNIYETATNQTVVNDAVTSLTKAIKEFEASVNPVEVTLDELIALIAEADELINNTVNPGNYLLEYLDLATCTSNARTEVEKTTHEQDNVNTQVQRLSAAIEAFKAVAKTAIETISSSELAMYPVPCTTTITISAAKEIATIAIVNNSKAKQMFITVDAEEIQLTVSQLKAGVYFAIVTFADGSEEVRSFIKQ